MTEVFEMLRVVSASPNCGSFLSELGGLPRVDWTVRADNRGDMRVCETDLRGGVRAV